MRRTTRRISALLLMLASAFASATTAAQNNTGDHSVSPPGTTATGSAKPTASATASAAATATAAPTGAAGGAPQPAKTPERARYDAADCGKPDVVCVLASGRPLEDDGLETPANIAQITLKVFSDTDAPPEGLKAETHGKALAVNTEPKIASASMTIDVPDEPAFDVTLTHKGGTAKVTLKNPLAALERELFEQHSCGQPTTLCLDARSGRPFRDDTVPSLRQDQKLTVKAFGPPKDLDVTLKATQIRSLETLFRATPPTDRVSGDKAEPLLILKESTSVTPGADTDAIGIEMTVTPTGKTPTVYDFSVDILRGRYFLDVGLAMALTVDGTREVTATPIVGTGERIASVESKSRLDGALMLNAYVFGGRRQGKVWFLSQNPKWWKDLFGVQIGVGLNLQDPLQRVYLGLLVEPISGLAFSFGGAVMRGEYFPDSSHAGALVANGAEPFKTTKPMLRPYFAITLSTEIVTTAKNAFTTLSGLQ